MKHLLSWFDWNNPMRSLQRMFNLNDSRWGRGEDKPAEPGKPGEGTSQPEPGPPAQPERPPQSTNAGPPDLDELWRDFNRKLGALFGKKSTGNKGGGGTGGSQPSQSNAGIGIG
ncbi:MAG: protease modulator HflK N-terminal domain-containing protein, partial [Rhodoferax sp.]|nr:protease modulator HflK N-terminal domain-containing protein [Rhodoferax sp.]